MKQNSSLTPKYSHSLFCFEDIGARCSTLTPEESKSSWFILPYRREPTMVHLLIIGSPGETSKY